MSDIEHSVYKPIDGPWIALLVIGILMIISAIIAIVMLYFFWRRYQRRIQLNKANYILNPKPNGNNIQIPIQINDRQPQSYETQKMEVFVPQNDNDVNQTNLGEFHARFTPEDGIQQIHQTYQRATRAYF